MPICGVLITLDSDLQSARGVLRGLALQPEVTLGDRLGQHQPAVLEVRDGDHLEQTWARLLSLEGVEQMDLVYADYFTDQESGEDGPTS